MHLEGALDVDGVDRLRTALADVHGGINLDVRGLTFIDCAGVSALTEIARHNGTMTSTAQTTWCDAYSTSVT